MIHEGSYNWALSHLEEGRRVTRTKWRKLDIHIAPYGKHKSGKTAYSLFSRHEDDSIHLVGPWVPSGRDMTARDWSLE